MDWTGINLKKYANKRHFLIDIKQNLLSSYKGCKILERLLVEISLLI